MGQVLDLATLSALGDALARGLAGVIELHSNHAPELTKYITAVDAENGNQDAARVPPPLIRSRASWGRGPGGWWDVELLVPAEHRQATARWAIVFGRRYDLFAELHLTAQLGELPFEVDVKSTLSPRIEPDVMPRGVPGVLRLLREQLPGTFDAKQSRSTFQALDALTRCPVIIIDPSWHPDALRESAMRQRVARTSSAREPARSRREQALARRCCSWRGD